MNKSQQYKHEAYTSMQQVKRLISKLFVVRESTDSKKLYIPFTGYTIVISVMYKELDYKDCK